MKYIIDNDLHIHSKISTCSNDEEQTKERIFAYAKQNNLKTVCVTDHFWDKGVPGANAFYAPQDFDHVKAIMPLPKDDNIRMLFGCETELSAGLTLGIQRQTFDKFDFVIIPTTHFHMFFSKEVTPIQRARHWEDRFEAVLNMDLPFEKIGIAHLTCSLIAPVREDFVETLKLLDEDKMIKLFEKSAKLGVGIEISSGAVNYEEHQKDVFLRPFKIAKQCGCKFYLGSDAHHPTSFGTAISKFQKAIDEIGLCEDDKFII